MIDVDPIPERGAHGGCFCWETRPSGSAWRCAFSSAGTQDPDGTIASYLWDFGDGTTSAAPNPSKAYQTAGTFTPTLTVTDNAGAIVSTSTQTITIQSNEAPVAAASGLPTTGTEPLVVSFSSAGTSDSDGTISSYNWDFGDGTPYAATANPTHTYSAAGTYLATLTVTDDFSTTDTTTVTTVVNVDPGSDRPAMSATPQSGPRPLVVSFGSSSSVDPRVPPSPTHGTSATVVARRRPVRSTPLTVGSYTADARGHRRGARRLHP